MILKQDFQKFAMIAFTTFQILQTQRKRRSCFKTFDTICTYIESLEKLGTHYETSNVPNSQPTQINY